MTAMMSARGHSTTAVAAIMTRGTMKALHRPGMTMEVRCDRVLTSLDVALTTAASRWALNHPRGRASTCSATRSIMASQTSKTLTR